ncbi:MAG TPA: L-tyrosine/L-tryptophan isonitrile synthase family protein [Pyrinomonadaceae bacterium]|jgi:pyoverdine/dityrosine biosynthesis protein Dit1|nr:L-tyrosine/L-tryptophan isonitrile synthase family protein [Pyrinomonadaceae bacterium]
MSEFNIVDTRTRQRVVEAAFVLLAQRGMNGDLLKDAAALAHYPLERAQVYFRRDEDLVLALYARLAADLEARVVELPEGDIATRFRAAMEAKLTLAGPHREALASLLASLVDPRHELGALNQQTEVIRSRVIGVFSVVVLGATNVGKTNSPELVHTLYALHLALMLFWTLDRTPETHATRAAIDFICDMLSLSSSFAWLPNLKKRLGQLESIAAQFVEPAPDPEQTKLAIVILKQLFRHRRLQSTAGSCAENPCEQCLAIHLPKVRRWIATGQPVHFLLPSFPAKSPNTKKVLGRLPDMAEEIALRFLENVCAEVKQLYPPGARISICSDGRVFSDLVGVCDEDVTNYATEIKRLIKRVEAQSLDFFSMEDLFDVEDHAAMRQQLIVHYCDSLAAIENRSHSFDHHRILFNGIQRFLFEDRVAIDNTRSRSQLRKDCKDLAYAVIQRSDGWGRLISDCFPMSLRLSIHPQAAHSEKIGMLLGGANDTWLTPWHGVAVKQDNSFRLMRRHEAEDLGATIVEREGRPSYFQL